MFLTVCTLGIYSFWGRVAITKYLYGHTSFGDNSFEYHATGKELFIGFLKGMAIVVPILFVFQYLPFKTVFGIAGYIAVFFFVIPMIMVGKWRFWLSRSSYCNVRFKHNGEYKAFRDIWIPGSLLTLVTLGLYSPILKNKIQKYYFENLQFGNLSFAYTGDNMEFFWLTIKGGVLSVLTLGIYSFWYAANLNRYLMENTTFNGRPFSSTMTGGGLFQITITNFLIAFVTLGLGFPIAVNRMYGYYFANIGLDAEAQDIAALATQMDTGASALASGLEEAANIADSVSGIL